jgi:hypothetical protein
LQEKPLRTLQELWRLFLICGFSSQENSEENSPLAKFVSSKSSLLHLETVRKHQCDKDWVLSELKPYLPRQLKNKVSLVIGSYPHFFQAGNPEDLLQDLCGNSGKLKLFCDLSRGQENDKDIHNSSKFSRRIDHKPFPYIGNKQIRNILVNSGLSHNVVPLDSRWQNFFGDVIETEKSSFTNESDYLALENLLRDALIIAQQDRPDIVNLSVLDAIVFAHMSKNGTGENGWFGGVPKND